MVVSAALITRKKQGITLFSRNYSAPFNYFCRIKVPDQGMSAGDWEGEPKGGTKFGTFEISLIGIWILLLGFIWRHMA